MDTTALLRLLVAAALTAVIGIDRELRSKPAGLRTNMVVGIAAAAFTYVGAESFPGSGDPTRVASQIVSGIGFLGGGAIFAAGGKPHGLTTAAALWGSAAIGVAAGIGAYWVAIGVVAVTLLALWPLDWLAGAWLARLGRRDVHLQVLVPDISSVELVQRWAHERGLRILEVRLGELRGALLVDTIVSGRPGAVAALLGQLDADERMTFVSDVSTTVGT